MRQSTYSRANNLQDERAPVYRDADDIPLERDIQHRYRRVPPDYSEADSSGARNYDSTAIQMLAAAVGSAALLTWWGTRSRSSQQNYQARGHQRYRQDLARDETDELIASNKVEGTAVYDLNGEKIGSVDNFMVGKRSGRVAYAVISFGGFMGMGGGYHAVPWSALTYSEKQGGYVVPADKNLLRSAPSFQAGENPFSNPAYTRQVSQHWLVLQ